MSSAVWEVIGGKKDGILVREGKSIKSDEADTRLGCHSFLEEIELDGERLHYRLLSGSGPDTGWVSTKMKGQDLVVPAKMVVKKDPKEKEFLDGQAAPKEWPTATVDWLQAVVDVRRAFPDWAPSLRVAGDVSLQLVIDNYYMKESVYFEVKGEAITVRQAGEDDKPDFTITTRASTLQKLWKGILDLESACGSSKLYIFPVIPEERAEPMKKLLTTLLVLEGVDSIPADGVRRPVPLERGGQLPPPPQPSMAEVPAAPDWLIPDGKPEKKRKILFLSIPWSGHIVHLKRIAEWFSEHAEYEVHFACMTETPPKLAEGIKVYTATPHELTDVFDTMQEQMRLSAMVRPKGCEADVDDATAQGQDVKEDAFEDIDGLIGKNGHKLMCFLMRILMTCKPSIMVSDSCFSMGNLNRFGALFGQARTIYINSPGIKEERMVPTDLPPPADLVEYMTKQAAEAGKSEAAVESASKAEEPTGDLIVDGQKDFFVGPPPTPEEFMALGGKVPLEKISPKFRPIFDIPGFGLPMLMRLGDAMSKEHPALEPISIFPSPSWMVEQQPEGTQYFSCPLLPLPIPIGGKLQVGRQALSSCLDADLLDWLYSEEFKDPVVYVAFGTIVKGFKGVVRRLAEALDGGAWRVLWALPTDLQSFLPGNLPKDRWRVEHFVNQKDVLRCERVKLFLSHCGMNSTMEAMASGVPMVCHPFFMDQYEWARTVRSNLRAGVEVHKFYSDAKAIRGAIQEVLDNPSYKVNAMAVARRLRAQYEGLKKVVGPAMCPKANLGPGSTMIAAYILCLLKGKDPSFLYSTVHGTAPEAA